MFRYTIIKVIMCQECPHFKDNPCACGNSRYSCNHPKGPGGKLTQEIILEKNIHEECPLPKRKSTKGV